jgi:hypothetical protein
MQASTGTGLVHNEAVLAKHAIERAFSVCLSRKMALAVLKGAGCDFITIIEVIVAAVAHCASGAQQPARNN